MAKSALKLVVEDLPDDYSPVVRVGDVVRTGDHAYPCYRVIAMSDGRAWVRDIQDGTDYVVSLARCRRIQRGAPEHPCRKRLHSA